MTIVLCLAFTVLGVIGVCKIIYMYLNERDAAPSVEGYMAGEVHCPADPSVKETGPVVYFANARRSQHDREFRFNYKKVGDGWRAYILRMPALGLRSSAAHLTHRHWDGNKPYICWDQTVQSLGDMQNISRVWADNIMTYIATGKSF